MTVHYWLGKTILIVPLENSAMSEHIIYTYNGQCGAGIVEYAEVIVRELLWLACSHADPQIWVKRGHARLVPDDGLFFPMLRAENNGYLSIVLRPTEEGMGVQFAMRVNGYRQLLPT